MAKFKWTARTYPAGAVAASKGYTIKKHVDDSTLASGTTSVAGEIDYSQNGGPGPVYVTVTDTTPDTDVTRVTSSKSTGSGGSYALAEVPMALRALPGNNGIVNGYLNKLAITDPGTAANLAYATGAAVIKGIPVVFGASGTHAVVTARDATHPKACYLVVEVTGIGETEEGKAVLKDSCGAAAASPTLPSLTQTEATYQYPLASFTLGASGESAANSVTNLTDLRTVPRRPQPRRLRHRPPHRPGGERHHDQHRRRGRDLHLRLHVTDAPLRHRLRHRCGGLPAGKGHGGADGSIAPYANGVGNIATYVSTDASSDYVGIGNAYTLENVTGAGVGITCGLRIKVSGGTGTYLTGYLKIVARPRS